MNAKHGSGTTGRAAPARKVAAEVLAAVRDDDAYANLLLPARIAQAKLSPGDAALATELTYGTLRMQGRYDRIIRIAAKRETSAIDPVVLDVLRLGVHQLVACRHFEQAGGSAGRFDVEACHAVTVSVGLPGDVQRGQ